jgi:hypothetical protein
VASFSALYDACVLYPAPLRDVLMQMALTDLYQAKWSHRIHDEWMRNFLRNRPNLLANGLNAPVSAWMPTPAIVWLSGLKS